MRVNNFKYYDYVQLLSSSYQLFRVRQEEKRRHEMLFKV